MIFFSIGGVLLKRRYHRKRALKTSPQDPYLPYTTPTNTNPHNITSTNPNSTNPTNASNANNAEAGLGGGGGGIRNGIRSGTGSVRITNRRSTTQEMLQSGEWGPLAAGHHTGYKEGYGKGVRFGEGSDTVSRPETAVVKRTDSRGNKVRKKRSLRGWKAEEGIEEKEGK